MNKKGKIKSLYTKQEHKFRSYSTSTLLLFPRQSKKEAENK